jgi:GNAT superfamily N-acetyltransferase
VVTLTAEGMLAWQDLEDRSETLARRLVAPLGPSARARLEAALATAERLIRAATVDFELVDPTSPAAQQAVSAYFVELDRRFPGGFDPGDALTSDAASLREPTGVFVLASSDGEPAACGGVWKNAPDIAEIKRMWVDDQWRGAGLGSRLLSRLESEARRLGYSSVRLDTNPTLSEAIAMYGRAGYRPVERYNDNPYAGAWFEKSLAG